MEIVLSCRLQTCFYTGLVLSFINLTIRMEDIQKQEYIVGCQGVTQLGGLVPVL